MCVYEAIYRSPPSACQYTEGVPIPPPRGAEEGIGRSARLPGQYCSSRFLESQRRFGLKRIKT